MSNPKIEGGYYLKARCIQNSSIAHSPPYLREIWDWILKECNHEPHKINGTIINRGQCVRTYNDIIDGLHWMVGWRKMSYTKWQCENAMKLLKKTTMITTRKTIRGLFITVVKYDFYQNPDNYEYHKITTREPQIADTINKNDKKEEYKYLSEFALLWDKYPKKDGRKDALRHFKASVKTDEDLANIKKATDNYIAYVKAENTERQFIKNGSTFFNNWQDWIEKVTDIGKEIQSWMK